MGFWSSVSGFCSSVASGIGSVASSAWSGVKSVASKVKEVATNAVSWMADKAEKFVGSVKNVWNKVKPFINDVIRPLVKKAAALAAKHLPTFPWVAGALIALDKALGVLVEWEKGDLAKRIGQAINWCIEKAKTLKNLILSPKEMEEAQEHEEVLKEARGQFKGEAAQAVDLASLINSYAQLSTRIKDVIDNIQITDFDHYLRLRASQKLLAESESKLTESQDIDAITKDDLFLMEVGSELLKPNPQLSNEDMVKFDEIIMNRFGKKLIPFVFEEMVIAWVINLQSLESEWKAINDEIAKEQVLLRRLQVGKRLGDLESQEMEILTELEKKVPVLQKELDSKRRRTNEMRNYVFAAEGFLQMLEKDPEEYADKQYLMDDCASVGMIIIDCAQGNIVWEDLEEEQQELIIDFANIYEVDSQSRAKQLVEVVI